MKRWIADGLVRLAFWISPNQIAVYATLDELADVEQRIEKVESAAAADREETQKLKKNLENISLLVGLHRGIQTPGGRK